MGRPGRLFIQMVLVGVMLNLADWPYLDEILGATPTGVIGEMLAAQSTDKGSTSGAAAKTRAGYQLLADLQAVPLEPFRLPEPQTDKAAGSAPRLVLWAIPHGIDRPPKPGSLS